MVYPGNRPEASTRTSSEAIHSQYTSLASNQTFPGLCRVRPLTASQYGQLRQPEARLSGRIMRLWMQGSQMPRTVDEQTALGFFGRADRAGAEGLFFFDEMKRFEANTPESRRRHDLDQKKPSQCLGEAQEIGSDWNRLLSIPPIYCASGSGDRRSCLALVVLHATNTRQVQISFENGFALPLYVGVCTNCVDPLATWVRLDHQS